MTKTIDEALLVQNGLEKKMVSKELKELPSILWENEYPEKILKGTYNAGNGILAATNKRLIFVDKGMLWGLKVEDFPFDKITSIQYEKGMVLGKITIYASGNKATIQNIANPFIQDFCEYIRARITKPTEHAAVQTSQSNNDDMILQIEKLAKLKEQGILTEEEFQAKKKQILGL